MAVWRMAFKFGSQGYSLWPQCLREGVAAIAYYPVKGIDLSKYSSVHLPAAWKKLKPTQQVSLRRVAFEMKPGDTIYTKEGELLAGRGTVLRGYLHVPKTAIIDPKNPDLPFEHQVQVEWDRGFVPLRMRLGSEPTTVLPIEGDRLTGLNNAVAKRQQETRLYEEGAAHEITAEISERSRRLRAAVIAEKGCICEACGFDFADFYGEIGEGFIEVHHKQGMAATKGVLRMTKVEDMAVVCANCHRMLHRKGAKPLTIAELQGYIKAARNWRK